MPVQGKSLSHPKLFIIKVPHGSNINTKYKTNFYLFKIMKEKILHVNISYKK